LLSKTEKKKPHFDKALNYVPLWPTNAPGSERLDRALWLGNGTVFFLSKFPNYARKREKFLGKGLFNLKS